MNDYPELRLGDIVNLVQERRVDRTKWCFDKYIAGEHIESGEVRIRKCGQIKGNEEVIGSAFHMRFKPGHVLYSTRRAYLRKAGIVDFEGICSNVTLVLQADEKKLLQSLLPFILQSEGFVQFAISHSIGSTNPFVKWTDLSKYKMMIPQLTIQKKISQILWAIEDNIKKSEKLVEAAENLKKGLLAKLLTEGLGHKEFKDTEIGKIPTTWEVVRIGDKITLQRGYDLPDRDRKDGQFPVIGSNGIVGYHDKYMAEGPGVIVGRSGTLGKVYYCEKNYWPLNTSLFVKQFKDCDRKFIFYLLQRMDLTKFGAGTSVPTLNRNLVHPTIVAFPKEINEQKKIALLLDSNCRFIEETKDALRDLTNLSKKLTNSLLSGELRITKEDIN
jgi:type I restriction enzyme, S subunit